MPKKSEMTDHDYIHVYDYKAQKAEKPAVEVLAEQVMDDGAKAEFLAFVGYLKQQNMTLRWFVTNSYNVMYKGSKVAQIYIFDGSDTHHRWRIKINTAAQKETFGEFLEGLSGEIVDLYREKFSGQKCVGCSGCAPGETFDFAGGHYENVCNGSNGVRIFYFRNPDAEQTETIKKLIDIRKEFILKMKPLGYNNP